MNNRKPFNKKVRREKKIVVVWEKGLTDEQRKNYEAEHPGYRLSFEMRYPNFPIYFTLAVAAMFVILAIGLSILLILRTI